VPYVSITTAFEFLILNKSLYNSNGIPGNNLRRAI
jgi:hypothetical protein